MKRKHRRWVKLGVLILLPMTLFFVTRQAVSWKPVVLHDGGLFAISPDEQLLAYVTNGDPVTISVFDPRKKQEILHRDSRYPISLLTFSPNGQELVSSWSKDLPAKSPDEINTERVIGVWLLSLKGNYREFQATKKVIFDYPRQLRFAPDGKSLWMASTDNLRAWAISSGKIKCQWHEAEGRDSSLPFFSALSPDCKLNYRSDSDGYSVWDVPNKKLLLRTKLPYLADGDLIFSDDGTIASYYASTPDVYYVIETRTGRRLWQTTGDSDVVFSHDKAINRNGEYYMVREARTGKLLYRLPAAPNVYPVQLSSRFWVYSMDQIASPVFRQRLDEPPFYLRPLLLR